MNNNRRKFLQNTSLLATSYWLARPLKSIAGVSTNNFLSNALRLNAVEILHTANLHRKLGAFAVGGLDGVGGLHNVHAVIQNNSNTPLLVDAGGFTGAESNLSDDINMVRQMNKTGYTAVTIGNNELLKGEEHLAALVRHMNFAIVNCNYTFSNPALKAKVMPYQVVRYGQYKVGITGVGPAVSNVNGLTCSQPVTKANEVAACLKNQLHCDIVICLSHLGFEQKNGKAANKAFAAASEHIDIIIGSHNKTIVSPQFILRNNDKKQVVLSTAGYGGSVVGAITFGFNQGRGLQTFNCKNYVPGSAAGTGFYDNYKKLTA